MKVLVCGSRSLRPCDLRDVFTRILRLPEDTQIIHGNACGVDRFAGACAEAFGMPQPISVKPEWEKYGRAGGPIRNRAMLDMQPDLVLAFWDGTSRGTKDTIDEATRRGIPVEILP